MLRRLRGTLNIMPSTSEIRQRLRKNRNRIDPTTRQKFDFVINSRLIQSGLLLRSPRIACYLSNDGEPDLTLFLHTLYKHRISHYLPIVTTKKSLRFARYNWGNDLSYNHYGIAEPADTQLFLPRFLSIVLTPLVGFDLNGNRLGMGGGYYDRTFGFIARSNSPVRSLIVGIAYESQAVAKLPSQSWDVPLDAVVTEKTLHLFSARAKHTLT